MDIVSILVLDNDEMFELLWNTNKALFAHIELMAAKHLVRINRKEELNDLDIRSKEMIYNFFGVLSKVREASREVSRGYRIDLYVSTPN